MTKDYKFRQALLADVDAIMLIIKQAQSNLKALNIDQWQNNYPNPQVIKLDIINNNSYLIEIDNDIVATVAILFENEPTYNKIYKGSWLTSNDYATIHRIAVSNDYKGQNIATRLINHTKTLALTKGLKSLRVDTHKDNLIMQNFLMKNGFKYCGIIYLSDSSKRLAYELVI